MTYEKSDETDMEGVQHPFPLGAIGCFPERLRKVMGLTKARAFARECGLSEGAIRSYMSGETFPTLDRLAQIAHAKGVEPMWLAFGVEQAPVIEDETYAYIPLYDARCSAGHGAWNERAKVLTHLAFTRYSLRKKGLHPENLACLRNDGDSMLGLINDDDTVMIDLSRDSLEGEAVYVILLDDHLYAKRLQRQFDGSVTIISHNKDYQPMTVPRDRLTELQIVGRAVWAGGWLI
ncbi:XRE family transcriptional regulator [Pseudomonas nitroreducens]|uniref:XRE family transcriptional regulator n=1 Tax=Pseudomonas nitroreducens TaxID=46680 RepID=UPI00147E55A2|nr:S24 family peptidase [Pseudomonas nitroreducens]NNN24347.1 helix-turn-helix transcriptional regulator [Pseudomonas nitroreducens]